MSNTSPVKGYLEGLLGRQLNADEVWFKDWKQQCVINGADLYAELAAKSKARVEKGPSGTVYWIQNFHGQDTSPHWFIEIGEEKDDFLMRYGKKYGLRS